MIMIEYALINDPDLQSRVRSRYEAEIASLQRLGFRMLGCSLETQGPFSAIWQLPVLLWILPYREFITFPRPLRLAVATALLRHSDPSTIALCMGKGVKLYTGFTDKTILISSTFRSYAVPRPTSKIIRPLPSPSIETVWPAHSEYVGQLEAQARHVLPTITYDDFLELAHREDDLSQYE
jgi:hypothetical protein